MGTRYEDENIIEVIEFAFCYDKDKLWISIQSLVKNIIVEKAFKKAIQEKELNDLCSKICKDIDDIFDIEKNKKSIINIIRAINKEVKKLPVITVYWALRKEFDEENNLLDSYPIGIAMVEERGIKYISNNNEYLRLNNYVNNNIQDFLLLVGELYYTVKKLM